MLKEAAIYNFFAGFGIPAYEENSVPAGDDKPTFPYITYELRPDAFSEFDTAVTFSIWDSNSSWLRIANLAKAISYDIGRSGKVLKCDDGYILVYRDTPFAQAMAESDRTVKRYLCSAKMRYYTSN